MENSILDYIEYFIAILMSATIIFYFILRIINFFNNQSNK